MDPQRAISAYLAEVRLRMRVLHLVQDGALFVSALAVVMLPLLLIAALGQHLFTLRITGAALLAGGLILFGTHLLLRMRHLSEDTLVARQVGTDQPALFSDLLSTVELGRQLQAGSVRFSGSLYRALSEETWSRLRAHPAASFAPASRLKTGAILAAAAALLWTGAATRSPEQLRLGAANLFSTGRAEEGLTAPDPLTGDLTLIYHYPDHMGRPDKVVQGSTGDITAPRGTRVHLAATLFRRATAARLLVSWRGQDRRSRLELAVKNERALEGELQILNEGSYRLEVQRPDERAVLDPMRHRIELEPDAIPRAILFGPANDLEVTARHRLELAYSVEDDFGVIRVDLAYQVEGGSGRGEAARRPPLIDRIPLWKSAAGERQRRTVAGRFDWDLGLLDLQPGARVTYWVEALDNDKVSGPKPGRSASRQVRIYSAEEKHARTLDQHRALVEQALRLLADRLLLFEREPDLSPVLRLEKNQSVHTLHGALVDALRELRNQMRQDRLVPRAALRSVDRMHQRMDGLITEETTLLRPAEASKRKRGLRASQLGPLRDHNRKVVEETERDVLLLSALYDEQRLQSLLALGHELKDSRKRLQELLEKYRKSRDEKLRQELLRQLEGMGRRVAHLMSEISQLRTSIPDEYLNPEALVDLDLQRTLQDLSEDLRQGKLAEVDAALQTLDRKLEQMQHLLESDLQQYRSNRMTDREKAYAAVLGELRQMETEQRRLAERTARVVSRYRKQAARMMKSTINPFIRRELTKLEVLRKRVQEVDPKDLGPYDQEQLERVKQRVQDLREMLDQGDLEEALQMSRRVHSGLQLLQDDLTDEIDGQYSWKKTALQRALGRARNARKIAAEISQDLEDVFPDPRALLDAEDRRGISETVRDQQGLRKRLGALSSRLEKTGRASAFLGPETLRGLGEASELMGKATGKLRGFQPQEGYGAQEAAAEQLAAMQKQMQAARQPRGVSGDGTGGPRERIEIPGADSFQPPRDFREDLLDAMKERAPSPYRQQVKEYYEELVR